MKPIIIFTVILFFISGCSNTTKELEVSKTEVEFYNPQITFEDVDVLGYSTDVSSKNINIEYTNNLSINFYKEQPTHDDTLDATIIDKGKIDLLDVGEITIVQFQPDAEYLKPGYFVEWKENDVHIKIRYFLDAGDSSNNLDESGYRAELEKLVRVEKASDWVELLPTDVVKASLADTAYENTESKTDLSSKTNTNFTAFEIVFFKDLPLSQDEFNIQLAENVACNLVDSFNNKQISKSEIQEELKEGSFGWGLNQNIESIGELLNSIEKNQDTETVYKKVCEA